ncbi:FMN-binding domain protein [Alkaliphilus metalliredigens QYMF]|uniref:FMN-binding domain protein n=1 Tax=Alkaliphilus metalliredigens (strain QYMF) TaxID=293826 RepID=A6TMM8_ALKMQ|nr:FMN-binding protein [Alkaliphilus metalliredigens]ABR47446.1 FMN-binding domain protein [Alkaliphilus metalliredigens QYMF]
MTFSKRALIVGVVAVSLLTLTACGSGAATPSESDATGMYTDGTYLGTGAGYGGDIEVEIVVTDGAIAKLNVVDHSETGGISDPAFEGIEEQLIEKQDINEVEVVTGATKTSDGLIEAISAALTDAK